MAAHRARHKPKRQSRVERSVAPAACSHCETGFWRANPRQRYCSDSCRTLASRAKRAATEAALLALGGDVAADLVETEGLTAVTATLARVGWRYDQDQRAWTAPLEMPVRVLNEIAPINI